MTSEIRFDSVVEFGCGLGDIITRVNARKKYGVDIDFRVIRAARLINRSVGYLNGSMFDKQCLTEAFKINIDLVIMVNWSHNFQFDEIKEAINFLIENNSLKYVIIDNIDQAQTSYKFKHSMKNISSLGHIVKTCIGADGVRQLHLVKLG